ncbi:hypothetical protein LG307_07950 [Sutcliffiella horikoshii]|uniref:hypothetical protein n=1 Tax=Sutcliffiella horikoshii TaxID=79883 RepID=UPI00384BC546
MNSFTETPDLICPVFFPFLERIIATTSLQGKQGNYDIYSYWENRDRFSTLRATSAYGFPNMKTGC